jgi:hypothetical protein
LTPSFSASDIPRARDKRERLHGYSVEPFSFLQFAFSRCLLVVGRAVLVVAGAQRRFVFVDLTIFVDVNRLANAGVRNLFALISRPSAALRVRWKSLR